MAQRAPAAAVVAVAGSGRQGFTDGPAAVAEFCQPKDVAVAPDGGFFVADTDNHAVRRVAPDGAVTTVAGTGKLGGTDGPGEVATFSFPSAIVVDRKGTVFVTEFNVGRIRRLARRRDGGWVVSTVAAAGLQDPWGITVDPAGHLVVADSGHHRVVRVNPATGAVSGIAGDGTEGFRDGPGATARFGLPAGVAVDRHGDIFVAEIVGHRVRRISCADGSVTTVAGSGARGGVDGAGTAAQLYCPTAVAADGRGVLLVSDGSWDEGRLRRVAVSADRVVATVAVGGPRRHKPFGMAIDRDGSLLIAVPGAHQICRMTGLGLVPPSAAGWSLRAHRGLAAAAPVVGAFAATVMLCAMRLDANHDESNADAVPRLPVEMWLAILSMLRPDEMAPQRFSG